MATRMVTDCDKCGKEGINESFRLEIIVPDAQTTLPGTDPKTETKRLDLDTKCLGQELQSFLSDLSPKEAADWYDRLKPKPKAAAKKAA